MAFRASQGLLLIPDITGYTDFISSVELSHGQHIVSELLQVLLSHNELALKLSEVEGDALLFYRPGERPAPERIEAQARHWLERFHDHLNRLREDVYCTCGACQNVGNLSLKVVGHYGEIGVHRVGKVQKLVGQDVVLAHRLLKNGVDVRDYLRSPTRCSRPRQRGTPRPASSRTPNTWRCSGWWRPACWTCRRCAARRRPLPMTRCRSWSATSRRTWMCGRPWATWLRP
jgi:hypothetical protein